MLKPLSLDMRTEEAKNFCYSIYWVFGQYKDTTLVFGQRFDLIQNLLLGYKRIT